MLNGTPRHEILHSAAEQKIYQPSFITMQNTRDQKLVQLASQVGDSFYGSFTCIFVYSWASVMICGSMYVYMCTCDVLVCEIMFRFSTESDVNIMMLIMLLAIPAWRRRNLFQALIAAVDVQENGRSSSYC